MLDFLFAGVTAVNPSTNDIFADCYVGVRDGRIAYLGDSAPDQSIGETIDGRHKVLMPGIVNSHTHIPMTPFRGWGDGHDLHTWLNKYIFPYEAKLDSRAAAICAQLGLAEAIASGTTTIADMYYFHDMVAPVVAESGINANLSRGIVAFDPAFDFQNAEAVKETRELFKQWHGHDGGRILVDASIHGEYTSGPWLWKPVAELAAQNGMGIHVHISETKSEHDECIGRHGKTPLRILYDSGVLDSRVIAAHCVWVSDDDIRLMAERGVSAIHNPVSNLKLASGVAGVTAMRDAGVNVALGTDGVSSNDSMDMFEEIKLAAILHRGISLNPLAIGAADALRMATINGAKALGRADTGRLETGMHADLIMLDFDKPHLYPRHDYMALLAYTARGSDVCLTMSRGKILYRDGDWMTIDIEKIKNDFNSCVLPLLF